LTIFATNFIPGVNIIYNTALKFYMSMAYIMGFFNKKASLFYNGRIGLLEKINSQVSFFDPSTNTGEIPVNSTEPIVWFHCASVGEFEQGRPLIESYKAHNPSHKLLLTFFSPSGYELRKNYSLADWVFYLPMDSKKNAVAFLDIVKPSIAIFIKYEFWFNYLNELKHRDIPTYVASAVFMPNQRFFKWYGGLFRQMLRNFTHIFVQDKTSASLLNSIGLTNVTVSGDTRFDRVNQITKANGELEHIRIFAEGSSCWVAGSTWPIEEEMIAAIYPNLPLNKLVIVPHEVHHKHIAKINSYFSGYKVIKYSQIKDVKIDSRIESRLREARILIIDTVGVLSKVYKYGSFAYIGGGFGAGIHNTLEAATYGKPVIFGPKYKKFNEAVDLVSLGGAKSVSKIKDLNFNVKKLLTDDVLRDKCGVICREYIENNLGATERVISHLSHLGTHIV